MTKPIKIEKQQISATNPNWGGQPQSEAVGKPVGKIPAAPPPNPELVDGVAELQSEAVPIADQPRTDQPRTDQPRNVIYFPGSLTHAKPTLEGSQDRPQSQFLPAVPLSEEGGNQMSSKTPGNRDDDRQDSGQESGQESSIPYEIREEGPLTYYNYYFEDAGLSSSLYPEAESPSRSRLPMVLVGTGALAAVVVAGLFIRDGLNKPDGVQEKPANPNVKQQSPKQTGLSRLTRPRTTAPELLEIGRSPLAQLSPSISQPTVESQLRSKSGLETPSQTITAQSGVANSSIPDSLSFNPTDLPKASSNGLSNPANRTRTLASVSSTSNKGVTQQVGKGFDNAANGSGNGAGNLTSQNRKQSIAERLPSLPPIVATPETFTPQGSLPSSSMPGFPGVTPETQSSSLSRPSTPNDALALSSPSLATTPFPPASVESAIAANPELTNPSPTNPSPTNPSPTNPSNIPSEGTPGATSPATTPNLFEVFRNSKTPNLPGSTAQSSNAQSFNTQSPISPVPNSAISTSESSVASSARSMVAPTTESSAGMMANSQLANTKQALNSPQGIQDFLALPQKLSTPKAIALMPLTQQAAVEATNTKQLGQYTVRQVSPQEYQKEWLSSQKTPRTDETSSEMNAGTDAERNVVANDTGNSAADDVANGQATDAIALGFPAYGFIDYQRQLIIVLRDQSETIPMQSQTSGQPTS